jgi:hypothetical protein
MHESFGDSTTEPNLKAQKDALYDSIEPDRLERF